MVRVRPLLLHFPTYIYMKPPYSNHQSVKIDGFQLGRVALAARAADINQRVDGASPSSSALFSTACEGRASFIYNYLFSLVFIFKEMFITLTICYSN